MKHLFAVVAALAACGKSSKDAPKVDIDDAHVAAVNAALPADLKDKLVFEKSTVEAGMGKKKETYTLAAPKGWKAGFMPGSLEPADADNFGSKTLGKTSLAVGSDCNGSCEKKDWAAVADKVYFAQLTSNKDGKILKDEKGENRRTVVFEGKVSDFPEHDVAIRIVTAWWEPDATRYFTCVAELGVPVKGAAAAFEKACSKVSGN